MEIIEVQTKADWQLFHSVSLNVYQKDPDWIAPLESEIESIFDVQKNPILQNGEAKCFVLLDNQQPCGRIAAFIDYDRQKKLTYKQGGIGFFECLDNYQYANKLLETAENYLRSQEIELIDGLINFGNRDQFWGLQVRGFAPPLYQENYHPAYYEKFFLENNYQPYEQILTYGGKLKEQPFKRLRAISQRLQARKPMHVAKFSFEEQERFIRDFCQIYNAAFPNSPVSQQEINKTLDRGKDIIDPNLIGIAYYDHQPAGFIILYPDINPLLKHAKGKLNWINILIFLLKKQLTKKFNAKGISIGIHPDYQSQGIAALLMNFICTDRNLERYSSIYLAGVATQNHQIRSVYDKLNFQIDRVHQTYRKALKDNIAIEPLEFIEL